jgi:hypothetical protein
MLNSVMSHLRSVLTGTESTYLAPLVAVAMLPPVFSDVASSPHAFVWSATAQEHQQTMPRTMGGVPGGYQRQTWDIEIALTAVIDQTTPDREQAFAVLYDQVMRVLNTTPIPIIVTDPATAQQSQILTIGVNIRSDIASAYSTADEAQGLIRFGATITCEVEEKVDWSGGVTS